jgi:hypothetical protein
MKGNQFRPNAENSSETQKDEVADFDKVMLKEALPE